LTTDLCTAFAFGNVGSQEWCDALDELSASIAGIGDWFMKNVIHFDP
jgi:hypothetical protein